MAHEARYDMGGHGGLWGSMRVLGSIWSAWKHVGVRLMNSCSCVSVDTLVPITLLPSLLICYNLPPPRRAMGVLTAGSPCAVVLVPMVYVCAIATITRKVSMHVLTCIYKKTLP